MSGNQISLTFRFSCDNCSAWRKQTTMVASEKCSPVRFWANYFSLRSFVKKRRWKFPLTERFLCCKLFRTRPFVKIYYLRFSCWFCWMRWLAHRFHSNSMIRVFRGRNYGIIVQLPASWLAFRVETCVKAGWWIEPLRNVLVLNHAGSLITFFEDSSLESGIKWGIRREIGGSMGLGGHL